MALVKFLQTTGDQDQLDKIVTLSTNEKWTYVNIWLLGITDIEFGRNETKYGALDYVRDICDQLDLEYMSQVYVYVQVEG